MNPSRDIEKLFDKFGGDAGNYQEIGRENEAIHARTRWPLLATLDLSQPSIPNIAPRRDAHLPHTHDRSGEHRNVPNSLTEPSGAAPLNRGKPPLFARASEDDSAGRQCRLAVGAGRRSAFLGAGRSG